MDVYGTLLAVAVAAAAAAALLAVAVRVGLYRARLVQWVPLAAGVSLLAVVGAGFHHLLTDHGRRSPEPLEPIAFLQTHPVLIVIAACALLAMGLASVGERR